MEQWRAKTGVATVMLLAGCSLGDQGQVPVQEWIHLAPLEGEVGFGFDGSWEDNENLGKSHDLEFEERLRVVQRGDILDQRIATFSLGVEPTFRQDRGEFQDRDQNSDEFSLDYAGSLSVLHGTPIPFSFNADASRSTGDVDGALGSRSEFDVQTRSGAVNWKNPAFPSSIKYSEELREDSFETGLSGTISERDDVLRQVTFEGRNSKMNLFAEREWFDDRIEERDNDSTTNRARLFHNLRWGKGSRLNTVVDYFDRTGFLENERIGVNESLNIRHTNNLSSNTAYAFSDSSTEGTDTTTHLGSFGLTHQLYRNLTTRFDASAGLTDSTFSEEKNYEAELGIDYRKDIFWGGELFIGLGGGFGVTDRSSEGGPTDVINETQSVPGTLRVVLNRQFVDPATIVVTAPGGAPVFVEGVDYDVIQRANDFTELRIIGGGGINAGDTILVSYEFTPQASAKFYEIPFEYSAELDFGWIALFHRASGEEQKLVSGESEGALLDRRDRETGLELRWIRPATRATASAILRSTSIGDFDTDSLGFAQSLSHNFLPNASVSLGTSQTFTDSDETETDFFTGNLAFRYLPWPNLTVAPNAEVFLRKERGGSVPDEREKELFLRAGVDFDWGWRKLDLLLSYDYTRRSGTVSGREENRVMLQATRRF